MGRLQDGHLDVVEDYLLDAKKKKLIDVNGYDSMGWTPLHYAAQMNYGDIIQVLLKAGADPSLRDKATGLTPLEVAKNGIYDFSGPSEDAVEILSSYKMGMSGKLPSLK